MAYRSARLYAVAAVVATQVLGFGSLALGNTDDPVNNAPAAPTQASDSGPTVGDRKTAPRPRSTRPRPRRRKASTFRGYAPPTATLRQTPVPRPGGELRLFSLNTREGLELSFIYDEAGRVEPEAIAAVSRLMRDHRNHRVKSIDPRLVEVLATVYENFGKKTLVLVSGFRTPRGTLNFHSRGAAADIKIEGVPARKLRDYVRSIDTGGMGIGIYSSGFVHIDVRPPPSYYWTDGGGVTKQPKRGVRRKPRTFNIEEAGAQ
jgi:uncharacterized protein YcbK (DUF882 family)